MRIRPISYRQAALFINEHHRHHKAPQGMKWAIAAEDDDHIVGVATCGRPVGRNIDDGFTCEITRVCTDGTYNACSILYGACARIAREMGYRRIITYTLASEHGTSVKAAGFAYDGIAGGEHWTGERDRGQDIPHEMKLRWSKEWPWKIK